MFDLIALGLLGLMVATPLVMRAPSRMVWVLAMLPILNVVTDLTYDLPAATARSVLVPLRIGVLLAVGLYCLWKTTRHSPVTYAIILFLAYLACLLPMTSAPEIAAEQWLRQVLLMLMFVAAYHYVRNVDGLRVVSFGLVGATGLLLLNFVLAQVFSFGRVPYQSEADVYLGAGGIHLLNNLTYFALLVPVLLLLARHPFERYFHYAAAMLAVIAVLMVMKRISIVALGAGILVYLFFAPRKERRIAGVLAIVGVLGILSPYYIDTVLARSNRITNTEVSSGKHATDIEWLKGDWERSGYAPRVVLVGQELFLSRDHFGGRKLHNDYVSLLHGSGVIGLTLYLMIFVVMLGAHGIRGSPLRRLTLAHELRAVYFALVIACLIVGVSSGIGAVTPRSLVFLFLGAIAGVLDQQKRTMRAAQRLEAMRRLQALPVAVQRQMAYTGSALR
jgi:xanthosine utilization system XapX-like protein